MDVKLLIKFHEMLVIEAKIQSSVMFLFMQVFLVTYLSQTYLNFYGGVDAVKIMNF